MLLFLLKMIVDILKRQQFWITKWVDDQYQSIKINETKYLKVGIQNVWWFKHLFNKPNYSELKLMILFTKLTGQFLLFVVNVFLYYFVIWTATKKEIPNYRSLKDYLFYFILLSNVWKRIINWYLSTWQWIRTNLFESCQQYW